MPAIFPLPRRALLTPGTVDQHQENPIYDIRFSWYLLSIIPRARWPNSASLLREPGGRADISKKHSPSAFE